MNPTPGQQLGAWRMSKPSLPSYLACPSPIPPPGGLQCAGVLYGPEDTGRTHTLLGPNRGSASWLFGHRTYDIRHPATPDYHRRGWGTALQGNLVIESEVRDASPISAQRHKILAPPPRTPRSCHGSFQGRGPAPGGGLFLTLICSGVLFPPLSYGGGRFLRTTSTRTLSSCPPPSPGLTPPSALN